MLLYLDMNKLNFTMKKSMTREVEKKNIFGRSPPLRVFSFSVESWLPTSVTHLLVFSYVCVWTRKFIFHLPSTFFGVLNGLAQLFFSFFIIDFVVVGLLLTIFYRFYVVYVCLLISLCLLSYSGSALWIIRHLRSSAPQLRNPSNPKLYRIGCFIFSFSTDLKFHFNFVFFW